MRFLLGLFAIFLAFDLASCFFNETDNELFENKTLVKRKIAEAQWSQWSTWGPCSKTCGTGAQLRTRTCRGPEGQSCPGLAKEEKPCNQKPCPGEWSQWSQWSACFDKKQTRTRTCTGGACNGPSKETRACRSSTWSDWRPWSQCSATCGPNGQQTRARTCEGGNDCPNPTTNVEKRSCQPQPPPCVKWSPWSDWSKCSRTCGGAGEQLRNRTCVSDDATNNQTILATLCKGPNKETRKCNTAACPVAKWSDWSSWGQCANGRRSRTRTCNGGATCPGSSTETEPCKNEAGRWGDWTRWSVCTKTCAGGEQTRQRSCVGGSVGTGSCLGSATEKRPCNTQLCPTWGDWTWSGPCSVTCGNGVRRRSRKCVGGPGCIGMMEEFVTCTNSACKN